MGILQACIIERILIKETSVSTAIVINSTLLYTHNSHSMTYMQLIDLLFLVSHALPKNGIIIIIIIIIIDKL
jgi:hypothetical protein